MAGIEDNAILYEKNDVRMINWASKQHTKEIV